MHRTKRLILRAWETSDWSGYYSMVTCFKTMQWLGGAYDLETAVSKFSQLLLVNSLECGGKAAVQDTSGNFVGYAGVTYRMGKHPLGNHYEVGWCISRQYQGLGLAFEAATAVLEMARNEKVFAYSQSGNSKSCSLAERLGMKRCSHLDFEAEYFGDQLREWKVWVRENS